MRGPLSIALGLGAFSLALCAHAEPVERGALELEWNAPGGCPNGVEVVERVERLLGGPIANLRPEPIVARGSVRKLEELRFELELETVQREQRFARSMQAPSCAELADAGALVLALAIDPTLAERQAHAGETKPSDVPTAAALPPPLPLPPPPPAGPVHNLDSPGHDEPPPDEPPAELSSPEWAARLGLVLDLGTVAEVGYGPAMTAGAAFGGLRAELGVLWLFPQQTLIAGARDTGGAIDLVAFDFAGCFRPLRGPIEVKGCAAIELGRLHGRGFGTVIESEKSAFWFGAGAFADGRFRASKALFVALGGGFLYNPQDTEFTLENVGLVYRVPSVVGRFNLSIETEFE